MVTCNLMKKGDIYMCRECGIQIEVLEECDKAKISSYECSSGSGCSFTCCGEDLVRKQSGGEQER
jgi:hypothetical protein